mmetsp:Transcript_68216/g.156578  ORF Transcript_68216/g.156578 Transcript_68216/m.156578 type:complete len:213 (+) Transcript_68216:2884-3522(+)
MGVRQRSGHEKSETIRPCHRFVPQMDAIPHTVLRFLLRQHRGQRRIQVLPNILQQNPFPELDPQLQRSQKVRLAQLPHIQPGRAHAPHVLHVPVGLALRVNHQGPPPGGVHDDAVLDGHQIVGKLADGPVANFVRVTQYLLEGKLGATLDLLGVQSSHPLLLQLLAVGDAEGPHVRDHARCQDAVSREELELFVHIFHGVRPPRSFPTEGSD